MTGQSRPTTQHKLLGRISGMNGLMLRTSLLLLCLASSAAGQSSAAMPCHSIVLSAELSSGNRFERAIGGSLVFHVDPERLGPKGELDGWRITLVPVREPDHDYIYPVNPPLRFNGLQTLGPSYGDDTKGSLGHPHEMRFLLYPTDYDRISPLMTNALWPYKAPDPDKAADEYFAVLKALTTGQLKVSVQAYDADPVTDSIRHIKFKAEFTTPENFAFDPMLKPERAGCPTLSE